MKPIYREVLLAAVLGLVLPSLVLRIALGFGEEPTTVATVAPQETMPSEQQFSDTQSDNLQILLRRGENTEEIALEEYLVGVLLAELPASFEPEAKKAQAVVARTYAWKAWITGGKHGDGSVCVVPACCQSYIDPGEFRDNGGNEEAVQAA